MPPYRRTKKRVEIIWNKYLPLWFPFLMGISVLAAVNGAFDADKHPVIRGVLIGAAVLNFFFTYQWVIYVYVRIHGYNAASNAAAAKKKKDA